MRNKALFLDRDGVINKVVGVVNKKPFSPRNFRDFKLKRGVRSFLEKAKRMGFLNIVITNQPDIARGLMKKEELKKMHRFIKKNLAIDDIFVCCHIDEDNCNCRKPKPGLIKKAVRKWKIDLKKSFIIGDTWRDIDLGRNFNIKTILIKTNYNRSAQKKCDFKVKGYSQILNIIKKSI